MSLEGHSPGLERTSVYAKFNKYEFWPIEVRFLGHVVSTSGVTMDLEKVEAVMS